MPPVIEVSQSVYDQLKKLSGPLFSVSEVIDRLLNPPDDRAPNPTENNPDAAPPTSRVARERGATLVFGKHVVQAISVRDMYLQILQHLVHTGLMSKLGSKIPYRTSSQRYLLAKEPIHPNGNSFVAAVGYKGYYMEAHKNYQNALSGLQQIGKLLKIQVSYRQ